MNDRGDQTFRFVSLERAWPSCTLNGLENDDGTLRLAPVPSGATHIAASLGDATSLPGPSRMGVAADGTVYIADPARNQIVRVDACTGLAEPLACLGGLGSELGQLNAPRGVAVGPRDSLYVADTGNARIQILDRRTGQVRALLGAARPWLGATGSADDDTVLRAPVDVAIDDDGNVYVADAPTTSAAGVKLPGRVLEFDRHGRAVPAFAAAIRSAHPHPAAPVSVVVVPAVGGGSALLVLDADAGALAFTLAGATDAATTAQWATIAQRVDTPLSAAHNGNLLYVADSASDRVLVFAADGSFIGTARDLPSGVAALAVDAKGRLLVQSISGALTRLDGAGSVVESGALIAGPFEHEPAPRGWFTVHCTAERPPDSHVQLFTRTEQHAGPAPSSPVDDGGAIAFSVDFANAPAPTPAGQWRAAPADTLEAVLLNEPAPYVWIAVVLSGNGHSTPAVSQLRLDDDSGSWLDHLPALYRRDEPTRVFLERALALYRDETQSVERRLDELLRDIGPLSAADDRTSESWLEWLAGWLAFPLADSWTDAQRRAAVAAAFALESTRGTAESLSDLIALYSGASVRITQPALTDPAWTLGAPARLGLDTMLAWESPYGTVLDTTAALDRSHLLDAAHEGSPPFAALANRFCVEALAADFPTDDARRELVRVIETEKPASATYHLCVIEAAMRVGVQARVGIDAIAAGAGGVTLDAAGVVLDDRAVLSNPHGTPRRGNVGRSAHVGATAIVT